VDIIVGSIIYCTNCKHYAFLLDIYIAKEEDAADYHQLFRDAEWEEVFSWEGTNGKWYYFCKKAENGKREKIIGMEKTNVMRILDQKKIKYNSYSYADTGVVSGIEVAEVLNLDPKRVFKTLVTVAASGKNYVFVIPVEKELNLKKAARAVGEKSIEMLKSKDLLPLTGYIHGGCSPIGMKKFFPTIIEQSASQYDTIIFSAGKIGYQVEVSLEDLQKVITFSLADVCDD